MSVKEKWVARPFAKMFDPENIEEGTFYFQDEDDKKFMLNMINKYRYLSESVLSLPSLIMRRCNWKPINSMNRDYLLLTNPSDKYKTKLFETVDLISKTMKDRHPILVWGDYDVDGMTATTALYSSIRKLTENVQWFIPTRSMGYGLNVDKVKSLLPNGGTVITIDTGIAEIDEIRTLKDEGYHVIVTDHHIPQDKLPDADIILDPKLYTTSRDNEYMVSGCFVGAQVGYHLLKLAKYIDLNDFTDYLCSLISMSILSDMIDLNNAMRYQLDYGLICLNNTRNDGLLALLNSSGIRGPQEITSTFLSFSVIPKLNAAGRMDNVNAGMGVLLLEKDDSFGKANSRILANNLKSLNNNRKILETQMFDNIVEQIGQECSTAIVIHDSSYLPGLVGICAARLVERYHVPAIVLTGDDIIRGSGRAPSNVSLFDCLKECSDLLEQFGGHKVAAGLSLKKENLESFITKFKNIVAKQSNDEHITYIDADVTIENLYDMRFQSFLSNIEPVGNKNEPIMLILRDVTVTALKPHNEITDVIVKDSKGFTLILSKFRASGYDEFLYKQVNILLSGNPNYYTNSFIMDWRINNIELVNGV